MQLKDTHIFFWERPNFPISVADRYETTSHRGEKKKKKTREKEVIPTFCQALYSIMSYDEKQVKRWKNKKAWKSDLADRIWSN